MCLLLFRNHIVHVSDSGLVTIAGGKWTTYRSMAKDTMDAAVEKCALNQVRPSATDGLLLEGAHGWTPTMFIRLVQDFGLESEVAMHLANTYGDRAFSVLDFFNYITLIIIILIKFSVYKIKKKIRLLNWLR